MKNLAPIIMTSLVLVGLLGVVFVMRTQTTGQATFKVYERPSALQRVLTTDKCETVGADLTLNIADCQAKGKWDCAAKYPLTPGGALNICVETCITDVLDKCATGGKE